MAAESSAAAGDEGWQPGAELRTDVPHSARMYDYYLGGKDNFAADREAAEKIIALFPDVRTAARANRRFLGRAVRYAAQHGIRQFLDIGTGIPTAHNTHEVAQAVAPDARVVYVDNDPIVLAHARALLRGSTEGRTAYVDADFRDPESILGSPAAAELIDREQPVALQLVALLHFFPDAAKPYEVVSRLLDVLAPGSMLIVSHISLDFAPKGLDNPDEGLDIYKRAGIEIAPRSKDEVARFFDGLELVEPGVVATHEWRAEEAEDRALTTAEVPGYSAVGVKR